MNFLFIEMLNIINPICHHADIREKNKKKNSSPACEIA